MSEAFSMVVTLDDIVLTPQQQAEFNAAGGAVLTLAIPMNVTEAQFIPTSVQPGPQAMLRWSNNGGRTWSSESWASIGRVGEYKSRVRWRRLGRARDRVYELTISEPVKVIIIGAAVKITEGVS